MLNSPSYFALLEACAQPGCPVCRLEQQDVECYLDHLFYENINDGGTRAHLSSSLGFCREHTNLLLDTSLGDALGMSIIYHDVLGTALKQISVVNFPLRKSKFLSLLLQRMPVDLTTAFERVKQAVTPHKTCLACQQRDRTAWMVLAVLLENIREGEMAAAISSSDGVCLPHLSQVFDSVKDTDALKELLKVETQKLENLHTELAEYIRKSDYRFLKDGFGSEGNAWRRAAVLAAGARIEKTKT